EKTYLLLDEVTFVPHWEDAVKFLIDNGFAAGTLVFTGSLAADLKRGAERFPGRGIHHEFYLPLSFREYATTFGSASLQAALRASADVRDLAALKRFASRLLPHLADLNRLLENYLITGRYFRSAYEYVEKGAVSQETYETYLNWALGDLSKLGKQERIFKQVVAALVRAYGSPLSANAVAKQTDIGSHKTVAEYLDAMNDLLLLNVLPKIDLAGGETVYRKEKKYYFTDPLLYSVFSGYTRGLFVSAVTEENKSFLLEGVVLDFLRRTLSNSYVDAEHAWFYRDRRGEVDFVIRAPSRGAKRGPLIPLELKWQNSVTERDMRHGDLFPRSVILSKRTFREKGKTLIIPLATFLAAR
ncbi:MAG TPA: ATP-binding protein, partial [archaeon]|nr:ATP-binding protein [archaeon]